MSGISFLLSFFPCLEDNMLPPVGYCNIHHKVKLFSAPGCLLRALVLNHSPCINMAYGNYLTPWQQVHFSPRQSTWQPTVPSIAIFMGCTLDKGISMAP